MKKGLFYALFFLLPAIPAAFYLSTAGTGFDSYTLSVGLGVFAFILVCNQFVLASRPGWVIGRLGLKGLLSLHSTVPVLILALAGVHQQLKVLNGFSEDTQQARFGIAAWVIFALAASFAVLLMANTFWMKIEPLRKLKTWIYAKTGLEYKRSRMLHNVTVVAGLIVLVHISLASSSAFAVNPAGWLLMLTWMAFSLGSYLTYRLKGRSSISKTA